MVSGLSASVVLTSATRPLTGLYTSEAALTDSTTATALPASTLAPISGSSTYTRSPSSDCAWSEIPTVTRPLRSGRAHSLDLRSLRSPGISLIGKAPLAQGYVGTVVSLSSAQPEVNLALGPGSGEDAGLRLAFADERELHHPDRHLAATDVDPHLARLAGGDARERDRLAQGRGEGAGQDLALATGGQHLLAVAQHAAFVHHQADQLARHARRLLRLQRGAADEVAALVQRHGPGQAGFPRGGRLVHVLAIEVHARFQAQGVARAQAGRPDPRLQQRVPERDRLVLRQHHLEAVLAGVAGARQEQLDAAGGGDVDRGEAGQGAGAVALAFGQQADHRVARPRTLHRDDRQLGTLADLDAEVL